MARHECGDVFPEERICDECAGILPSIKMYDWGRSEVVTVEVIEEPILVDNYDGEDMWFQVDIRFEDGAEHYADYDEETLRWESGDATYRTGELL